MALEGIIHSQCYLPHSYVELDHEVIVEHIGYNVKLQPKKISHDDYIYCMIYRERTVSYNAHL